MIQRVMRKTLLMLQSLKQTQTIIVTTSAPGRPAKGTAGMQQQYHDCRKQQVGLLL